MDEYWQDITVVPESNFFPVYQQVLKQMDKSKNSIQILVNNPDRSNKLRREVKDSYKFFFDWIDDDTCKINVMKKVI